jgi:hypothetical protein
LAASVMSVVLLESGGEVLTWSCLSEASALGVPPRPASLKK